MQEDDIIALLTQVGLDLEETGLAEPIRLLLIGGAYMVTQLHNRATTGDIDVALLERHRWGKEYELFRRMIHLNLTEMGGDDSWFSDDITEFLPEMGMPKSSTLWLSSGKLEVYIPETRYILVLKLLANRDKDEGDLQTLLVTLKMKRRQQAEALLNRYVSASIREVYAKKIEEAFKKLFPQ